MRSLLPFPIFIGICCLLIGSAAMTTSNTSAAARPATDDFSRDTNRELARARAATAKYHDFDRATASSLYNSVLTTSTLRCISMLTTTTSETLR